MKKIKTALKKNPIIYDTYQKLKLTWNCSKLSQMIIMNKILKYSKSKFYRYAGAFHKSRVQDTAYLTWLYHVVEKGLAMPNMKIGFGEKKVGELCEKLENYKANYGIENVTYLSGVETLYKYRHVHQDLGFELPTNISNAIDRLTQNMNLEENMLEGGYTRDSFYKNNRAEYPVFASSRHSVRDFDTKKDLALGELIDAIKTAQTAPSACNRQPTRVHIVTSKAMIEECLAMQNGNRGFGNLANKLLIVTGDLQTILGAQEFFDLNTNVGIFIMNLSFALHYHEIAHCILNWYAMPKEDIRLHKIVGIPDQENVIAFIVCGKAPNEFKIAISPRVETDEIVKIH